MGLNQVISRLWRLLIQKLEELKNNVWGNRLKQFEVTSIYPQGIRNDIDEKFLGKDYYVNVDRFNYDSVVGMDKILERNKQNSSEYNAGNSVDGIFEYRYINGSNNLVIENVWLSGGTIFKDDIATGTTLKTGLNTGRATASIYQNKLFIFTANNYPQVYDGAKGTVTEMGAPLAEDAGVSGSPSGTYQYKMTYITSGGEEVLGTVSNALTVSSSQITVNLPIGYSGTTQRKLYRTESGGSTFYIVTTIEDNTILTYTDNKSDAQLLLGEDQTDLVTAQWQFNEGSGTTASDETGNHPITLTAAQWGTGIISNAIDIDSTNQIATTGTSANFQVDAGQDFTFFGWLNPSSFADGWNAGTSLGWNTPVNALSLYVQSTADSPGVVRVSVGNTSGDSATALTAGKYHFIWLRRTAGVVEMGFLATDDTFSATPKVTFTDNNNTSGNQMSFQLFSNGLTAVHSTDQWTFMKDTAISDVALEAYFNGGSGTESNNGGAETIPGVNNELPKPKFSQVQFNRLAACGTDRNSTQLFVTDTFIEMFDPANAVEISGNSSDNTPLEGISQDYINTVVFSGRNVFLADLSADPVTSKVTRANVGCKNGYTIQKLSEYKAFPGGVWFLSTLDDFRLFNSNFAQPIISASYGDDSFEDNWSRAVQELLSGSLEAITGSGFYDYKYHISFGDFILYFDIRNRAWGKLTSQDSNVFGALGDNFYTGRIGASFIDQMYAKETIDGTTEFNGIIESGALMASENENFFKELFIYFNNSGYNKIKLEVFYEDDFNNPTTKTIFLRGGLGYYDPEFYTDPYYVVTREKNSYFVFHLNRWARWMKWRITSEEGRFQYRGYKLTGDRSGERQSEK